MLGDADTVVGMNRQRRVAPSPIAYPAELPISARREDLLEAIGGHQVVIVAGETGSGKSTQLPKLCLELGRGTEGWIGHTQPRRIAARSIAERVAAELGGELGGVVGYAVRFTDEVSDQTMVKLMTDGILLAETQRDRRLDRYDTVIIDEAHERSLNIDFLLGYLHGLLPRRPDLKVIITSATIDTERFSEHFDGAPVVEVSGRTYPVELRYRPLDGSDVDELRDQPQGICDAVVELFTEGDGDILVFCSGEREIRDAVDALAELELPDVEIVPLFARLSIAEQHRVFAPHRGRRIVVATNVAETSLTVPGIRAVVDNGTARISRYSRRTKVQRLPIEPISRASADQRAGRCGRISPGVCIRLYSEEDYAARPEFTEPEIQRTNLASVILQMAAAGLGEVESFPFVDPPDHRNIRDGVALLHELGAVTGEGAGLALTRTGRTLARLPIDPRLGRMLIEAGRNECLRDVLVIASGSAIQDPRDRPADQREEADQHHRRFVDPSSDFLTMVDLWDYLETERKAGSSSRFRRLCRREFLNYPRVREWQDIHAQLRRITRELGLTVQRGAADPDVIHRSLLAGLLSHVGHRDRDGFEYRGARNARFAIAPGSALFKRSPRWVMAAELVETNRLWARGVAPVHPEWIEELGEHLLTRSYTDPRWDAERGAAVASETVSIYGLVLVAGRIVMWSRVDPDDARMLFIHHALVRGEWETRHRFVARNAGTIEEVRSLEARHRTELLVSDDALAAWFDARLPADITSVRHFDRWWREASRSDSQLLDLTLDDLVADPERLGDPDAYPDTWRVGDLSLPIGYEHDPASPDDGITIEVPVAAVGRLDPATFDWLVPGFRRELVTALVRSLPKSIRKQLVPVADTVDTILPTLDSGRGLAESVGAALSRHGGVPIPADAIDLGNLPLHLRPNFRIVSDDGVVLAHGGDLRALRRLLDEQVRASLGDSPHRLERSGLTSWPGGDLPRRVELGRGGHTARAYPALVDEGDTVAVQLLATAEEQHRAMWAGTRRLLLLERPAVSKPLRALLDHDVKLALVQSPYPGPAEWFDDLLGCAVDQLMIEAGGPAWTEESWNELLGRVRAELPERVADIGRASAEVLTELQRVELALEATTAPAFEPAVVDVRNQLDSLVYPGFLTGVGARNLPNLRRYLQAAARRLERLPENLQRDLGATRRLGALEQELDALVERLGWTPEVEELTWQLQELRVSLFAQQLGTAGPVSEKRIRTALQRAGQPRG